MDNLKRLFWVSVLFLMSVSRVVAIEEAKYSVLLKEGDIEVREYESYIIAQTLVEGSFEEAGDRAFKTLFNYIAGENQLSQEVDMTAPVGQAIGADQAKSQEIAMTAPVGQVKVTEKWAVSFMMPSHFTMETTPKPNNQDVIILKVPSQKMAAIRYSGFWDEDGYLKNKAKLKSWLTKKGYSETGSAIWARYNPPIMPWFLRRNEVLIPIDINMGE